MIGLRGLTLTAALMASLPAQAQMGGAASTSNTHVDVNNGTICNVVIQPGASVGAIHCPRVAALEPARSAQPEPAASIDFCFKPQDPSDPYLNMRDMPDPDAGKVVGKIPDSCGIIPKGRRTEWRGQLWLFVSYNGIEGWLSARYLTDRSGRPLFAINSTPARVRSAQESRSLHSDIFTRIHRNAP